jgi:hypothetical protein
MPAWAIWQKKKKEKEKNTLKIIIKNKYYFKRNMEDCLNMSLNIIALAKNAVAFISRSHLHNCQLLY